MGLLARSTPIATSVLLLFPASASAEELHLGVDSGVTWTNNVFGVSEDAAFGGQDDDPDSDFAFQISPSLEVQDRDGRVTWSAHYRPTFDAYAKFSDLNGFDHVGGAQVGWTFAPRWKLNLAGNLAQYNSATRFNQAAAPGDEVALGFRDLEVRTTNVTAELDHKLSERDDLSFTLLFNSLEYPDGGGTDRDIPGAILDYMHRLDRRTKLGGSLSWTQQRFRNQASSQTSQTDFYNLAATLEHRFSQRFRVEASAGPTFIDSTDAEDFSAPVFATSATPFGPVALNADLCEFNGIPGASGFANFLGCQRVSDNLITQDEAALL
jgi:predicted porin